MTIASLEDLETLVETIDVECKAAQGRDGSGELPESIRDTYSAMPKTPLRLKTLTTEHPKDITAELMRLARDGFLVKHGETRAAAYFIPGMHTTSFALELGLGGPTETLPARPVETTVETPMSVEMSVETSVRILEALRRNPSSTLSDVAEEIGRSLRTIERVNGKLVDEGKLRRVGPKKGGHWEVLEKQ
jgi:hypothetical protein